MVPHYMKAAPLALCLAAGSVAAQQSDTQRIDQLEQRLTSLQKQMTNSVADRVHLNGFFSTGYATASNDAGFAGITDESEVKNLSLMALQGSFAITDDTKAIMQLISRGTQDWDTQLEWAYLSHQVTNDLQIRAGKMRLPFFMYSDSLEVGYAQPWARPPQAVYGPISVSSYVGADASYTYRLGGSAITTQVFSGFTDGTSPTNGSDVQLRNIIGLNTEWTDYVWKARAIAATAETSINSPDAGPLADSDRGNFYGLGFGYDDGTWQVISELTRVDVNGAFADTDSAYLTVGRRIDALTPYVSVGWVESRDNDERAGPLGSALNTHRNEYSLGMRWDVLSGVAVKLDYTHVRGFENKAGGLNAKAVLPDDLDSTNVYTVTIDSAF